eukprot:9993194-Lingulodinium_polyedra.AAC.1
MRNSPVKILECAVKHGDMNYEFTHDRAHASHDQNVQAGGDRVIVGSSRRPPPPPYRVVSPGRAPISPRIAPP